MDCIHLQYVSLFLFAIQLVEVCLAAMNGKIKVGNASATHDSFYTLVLSAGGQETGVSVTAVEGNTDFVLVWIISRFFRELCILMHDATDRLRESHLIRRWCNMVLS